MMSTGKLLLNGFLLILIAGISGCGDKGMKINENDQKDDFKETARLIPSGFVKLKLDSVSSDFNFSIQYAENGFSDQKRPEVALVNQKTNSLYFYELEAGNAYRTIPLAVEGPNGVGSVYGAYIMNQDTILVQERGERHAVDLVDFKGKKLGSMDLQPFKSTEKKDFASELVSFPTPIDSRNMPAVADGKVYFNGSMDDSWTNKNMGEAGTLIAYDLHTSKVDYFAPYPESYENGIWSIYYRSTFKAFNEATQKFVYSFPGDHYVYVFDKNGKLLEKKYAGSKFFDEITSFPLGQQDLKDAKKREDYYFGSPSYSTLLYDKFRKVYYRFAEAPKKDRKPDEYVKRSSIIILDQNLTKIGEYQLSWGDQYNTWVFFISKEGLNLGTKSTNEDEAVFTRFVLKNESE
jgi:hypothetical protein